MARIILTRGVQPHESAAYKLMSRVAERLKEAGHDVEFVSVNEKPPRGLESYRYLRDSEDGMDRFRKVEGIASKNKGVKVFDFHNFPVSFQEFFDQGFYLPDSPQLSEHLKEIEELFGGMCPEELEKKCVGKTGMLPAVTVLNQKALAKIQKRKPREIPENLYAVEIAAHFKKITRKIEPPFYRDFFVVDAVKSRKAGLMSDELVEHIARGIHAIVTGAQR